MQFGNKKWEETIKEITLPIFTSLLFAGSYIAANITVSELEPLTITFLRYGIAWIFLTSLLFHFKPSSLRVAKSDLWQLLLLGVFGIIGYHYFFFLSLKFTKVANTAIINALSPIVTAIFAAAFLKERLSSKNYMGVTLAFAGVIILLSRGKIDNILQMEINIGDGLMLLAVLSWVFYSLLIKKLQKKYHSFTLTYFATAFGGGLLFFLSLTENLFVQLQNISFASFLSLLYMGIAASGLGYLLYNFSIKEIGPTKTSGFVYSLVPVFVAILALIAFKQEITLIIVLSTFLIIVGLYFMLIVKDRRSQRMVKSLRSSD